MTSCSGKGLRRMVVRDDVHTAAVLHEQPVVPLFFSTNSRIDFGICRGRLGRPLAHYRLLTMTARQRVRTLAFSKSASLGAHGESRTLGGPRPDRRTPTSVPVTRCRHIALRTGTIHKESKLSILQGRISSNRELSRHTAPNPASSRFSGRTKAIDPAG